MLLTLLLTVLLAGPGDTGGQTAAPPAREEKGTSPAPAPGLERLLRVPPGGDYGADVRGGRDRASWQAEFARLRGEIAALEASMATSQERLRALAADDWAYSPTGAAGPPVDPEVLKLRAAQKRDGESLEAARQRLLELEVEASLAGVPQSWIRPEQPDPGAPAGERR